MTKQTWSSPTLADYGSAAKITQYDVKVFKNLGSGDSVFLTIDGPSGPDDVTVSSTDGGSIINKVTRDGVSVPF
jgi:hypothetical protein